MTLPEIFDAQRLRFWQTARGWKEASPRVFAPTSEFQH
jgi:hypothetical protein